MKVVQSAEERQPRTEPEAVSQVTAPFAYVRPVEKVVVATPVHVPFDPSEYLAVEGCEEGRGGDGGRCCAAHRSIGEHGVGVLIRELRERERAGDSCEC